ncbi:MAG TPA: hypothetical protein VD790_13250 [Thermoleophilaceae bacterium]|nr:hypothetical protein [Thermoleophilaceae bacterium]
MRRRPPQVVSTVDLPSGRVLEIVQPETGAPYTRVKQPIEADRDLCRCDSCSSDLVEPIMWEAAGPTLWRIVLRCPNCEDCTEGVFTQECVDRYDERLDDGTASVVDDLKKLQRANMTDDVERFIAALHAGAIMPEDF